MFGGNYKNPTEVTIDLWKNLNALDKSTVGFSRRDWDKMFKIYQVVGAKLAEA